MKFTIRCSNFIWDHPFVDGSSGSSILTFSSGQCRAGATEADLIAGVGGTYPLPGRYPGVIEIPATLSATSANALLEWRRGWSNGVFLGSPIDVRKVFNPAGVPNIGTLYVMTLQKKD